MDSKLDRINAYKAHFIERYKEFGDDIKTLWNSITSQRDRFKILCEIGEINGKSLLDIGCGFGDFYGYLVEIGKKKFSYLGFDIIDEFIEIAKTRYPKANFKKLNILTDRMNRKFDWIFASGIFFLKHKNWQGYVLAYLEKMYELLKEGGGIGVNFLSSYSRNKDFGVSQYVSPPSIFKLVAGKITPKLILRTDYRENDFTIYIYKDKK